VIAEELPAALPADLIADTRSARIAEYKKRKKPYETTRVGQAELAEALASGWQIDREMQRGVRIRRAKSDDELLENQFWILLYLLGYDRLNVGRNFRVTVDVDGKKIRKQIDVLAIDDETVVVAECKTALKQRGRSLQGDLSEFDSVKRQIANAARSYIGKGVNPKFLWFMVTARLRWSPNDLARAKEKQIHVIRENELRYFMEVAKSLGRAARYQFHAEFLSGQKIPALSNRYVPSSRFRLGGRDAFAFTISARDLLKRSFVNHRDLRDPSGAPAYQRLVNPARIRKIAKFIESGGYFANSVLVNFHQKLRFDISDRDAESDTRFGSLYLPDTYKSCWIIDGQHRIYGAAVASDAVETPMIPVVAFENLPAKDEANLFATINREQKQVQKKLLDELDGELNWGSSDPREAMNAIAARGLDILRSEVLGPFEDRISLPGMRGRQQPLTVPQLKLAISQSGLAGRISTRDGRFIPGQLTGATNEESLTNLVSFLSRFFEKVRDQNPDRWAANAVPLCHNIAVPGLIRLASEIVRYLEGHERIDVHELFPADLADQAAVVADPFLQFCRSASDEEFKNRFPIKFGSGGPRDYFLQAAAMVKQATPGFNPAELEEFLVNSSKERTDEADKMVKRIIDGVHGFVVARLQEIYGPDFFEKGIKSKEVKIRAYSKRADDDPTGEIPLQTYLDLIELKKVIESADNWPHFKDSLNIQLPNQQKGLAKYVKWFDDLNDVRKKYAHPYNRSYSDQDVELLRFLDQSLAARLGSP
jgi:DGQHR domain-containing protein